MDRRTFLKRMTAGVAAMAGAVAGLSIATEAAAPPLPPAMGLTFRSDAFALAMAPLKVGDVITIAGDSFPYVITGFSTSDSALQIAPYRLRASGFGPRVRGRRTFGRPAIRRRRRR